HPLTVSPCQTIGVTDGGSRSSRRRGSHRWLRGLSSRVAVIRPPVTIAPGMGMPVGWRSNRAGGSGRIRLSDLVPRPGSEPMSRLRFTIAQAMALVLLAGIGFAALRSASVLWASAVFTLTVTVLSAALLAAMARRGRARMTWAGFALFGWIYL